ncbi:hypothetical protein [Halarchaeum sp. P4]|uniref:hypothetical protein n=1 Tax=Halarchaeum sp. P4 TaxID=3421639 RepID=UPI003EBE6798
MPSNRTALVLLVVGLLLLPGPTYALAADSLMDADERQSATSYQAERIDASNDTLLAQRYGPRLTFWLGQLEYEHVREEFRAPTRTRDALERAVANGSATTISDAVAADLRALDRNYTFLSRESDDTDYAFAVERSTETTTVWASPATDSEVAAAVRERLVVAYANMSDAEQRAFENIRNATAHPEQYDHQPPDEAHLPPKPIVERNGTHYAIRDMSSTDTVTFPPGFFAGLVASGLGVVCVLAAALVASYNVVRG